MGKARKLDGLTPAKVNDWVDAMGSPDLWDKLDRMGAERGAPHIDLVRVGGTFVASMRSANGDILREEVGRSRGEALVELEMWLDGDRNEDPRYPA